MGSFLVCVARFRLNIDVCTDGRDRLFIADPNAQVLKLSKSVTLQISEAQQQLSVALTLQANDEEVANNITSILNGLVSLMKLQTDKPESVKLGEAIALRQDGPVVHCSLTLPATDVVQMMKADAARKAQKKAAKPETQ